MKIPRRPLRSRRTLAAAAVLALGVGAVGTAGAVTAAPGGPAHPPVTVDRGGAPAVPDVPAAQRKAPDRATVTLVTGDRFRVDPNPDGTQSVTPLRASAGGTFTSFRYGGDQYVVPNTAAPYLGRAVDPRLFDVSYLVRAKLDDAHTGTVPVVVSGGSGAALPATAATSGTTTVAKKRARAFGRLLATRWRGGDAGSLPGGRRLGLSRRTGAPALPTAPALAGTTAGAAAMAATGKGLAFHTLTVGGIDRDGRPGTLVGIVQNVDDTRLGLLSVGLPGAEGQTSFSVPDGHYSLEFAVLSGPGDDLTTPSTLVVKPEVSVTGDTTVTLDARGAVPYDVSVEGAPADAQQIDMLTFQRGDAAGTGGYGVGRSVFDLIALHAVRYPGLLPNQVYAVPTTPAHTGTMDFAATTQLVGYVNGTNPDPRYGLVFPNPGGIPPTLTHHVSAAELTTVRSTVHDEVCANCTATDNLWVQTFLPWGQYPLAIGVAVPAGDRTDYWYSSRPDLTTWQPMMVDNVHLTDSGAYPRFGQRRTIKPGETVTQDWNGGPAGPSPAAPYLERSNGTVGAVSDRGPRTTLCGACRQGDIGALYLQPMGDADPTHYAEPEQTLFLRPSTVRFWRDGQLAVTSDARNSGQLVPFGYSLPMLGTAADYRLEWGYETPSNPDRSVDTLWRFRSGPNDAAATLAAGEQCAPDPSGSCSFLPLLYVGYDLALDNRSRAAAGESYTFGFRVTGQQHSAQRGTAATVAFSYDDGKTWSDPQAATAEGDGSFGATVRHPELANTDGYVSLRITAQDADGNSVTQTALRAYSLK